MIYLLRSLSMSAVIFAAGLVGFAAQAGLSAKILSDSKGMIGSVVGLDATMLALVLGLLIWTAHGLFSGQQTQLQTLVRSVVVLDLTLAGFGDAAKPARQELRAFLQRARGRLWVVHPRHRKVLVYGELSAEIVPMRALISRIVGSLDDQAPQVVALRRMFGDLLDLPVTMVRSLVNPVPYVLLNVVVAWSCVLFIGYGLTSPCNPLTVVMAALGALLVGSGAFLILELSDPYVGLLCLRDDAIEMLEQSLTRFETAPVGPVF